MVTSPTLERDKAEPLLFAAGLLLLVLTAAGAFLAAGALLGLPAARALAARVFAGAELPASAIAGWVAAGAGLAAAGAALAAAALVRRERRRRGALEERLAVFRQAAAQAGDLVVVVSRKGRIEYVNAAVEAATGYTPEELRGKASGPWLPWYESEQTFEDARTAVLEGGTFRGTVACRRKDGAPFVIEERLTALSDGSGHVAHIVSTASDVTRERRIADRLKFLGAYDPVTGLPNRRRFAAELDERVRDGGRLAVLILDVDRFKRVNDLFGTEVGDEFLRRIGRLVASAVREGDYVGRVGSDEFGVIHADAGRLPDAEALAERIRKTVSGKVTVGGQEILASVTIGIATRPEHGDDGPALLRHAGAALADTAAGGQGGVRLYSPEVTGQIRVGYSMERHLAEALRNGEYEVDYQPYCELVSRRLTGAEALLRWRNAELGAVSPSIFVPALEESGAILEVGEWVLRSACTQLREWKDREPAVAVAVNLSQVQFRQRDLVPLVVDVVRESGIDPRMLTLELTEGICISDMDRAVSVLKRLKDVGVSLSVDDFGTGYSSLSYIKRLPVDTLKIDQSFVREVARDPDAASIVSAITGLARSLRLKTIAEGVEQEDQRNVLHLLRCDYGQGYLFSPAVPAKEFERFRDAPAARA